MTYLEALRLLEQRQEIRWKLGLGRIRGALSALGDPQDRLRCVHVAGTNGKGSFAAILASVLTAAGCRTGLFTSPHMADPRERIRVDGRRIPAADFGRVIGRVRSAEPEEASYFEMLTAAAVLYFLERKVDLAILEVGLGGRLDATNVVKKPLLTVITSVSIDHTVHLGDTLTAIAGEKAGILKRGVPCLCGADAPEALGVVRKRCLELRARLITARPKLRPGAAHWEEGFQELSVPGGVRRGVRLRLLGGAAVRNASLALAATRCLRGKGFEIPDEAVARGFETVDWPCRFQVERITDGRGRTKTIVLDGAHNVASIESFVSTWEASPWAREEAVFVVGLLRDKEARGIARLLARVARRAVVTEPPSHRALAAGEFAKLLREEGCPRVIVEPDPDAAWRACARSDAPVIAACGSFYLVGEYWGALRKVPA